MRKSRAKSELSRLVNDYHNTLNCDPIAQEHYKKMMLTGQPQTVQEAQEIIKKFEALLIDDAENMIYLEKLVNNIT